MMIKTFEKLIKIRILQIIINNLNCKKKFKIPIHLALGHEAIGLAVVDSMNKDDHLVLPHRNIHYSLAATNEPKKIIEEFLLLEGGINSGNYGSMNLIGPANSIVYTSSILGNNFSIGVGVANAKKIINNDCGITFIITGDGAIEEGSFYESLMIGRSFDLPMIFIIENNGWSLASTIEERRKSIDLQKFSQSLGVEYINLSGNDVLRYKREISSLKEKCLNEGLVGIAEVAVSTLGGRFIVDPQTNIKRFINYHAGPNSTLLIDQNWVVENDESDPVWKVMSFLDSAAYTMLIRKCKQDVENLIDELLY